MQENYWFARACFDIVEAHVLVVAGCIDKVMCELDAVEYFGGPSSSTGRGSTSANSAARLAMAFSSGKKFSIASAARFGQVSYSNY